MAARTSILKCRCPGNGCVLNRASLYSGIFGAGFSAVRLEFGIARAGEVRGVRVRRGEVNGRAGGLTCKTAEGGWTFAGRRNGTDHGDADQRSFPGVIKGFG